MESSIFISPRKRNELFIQTHDSFKSDRTDLSSPQKELNQSWDESQYSTTRVSWMSRLSTDAKNTDSKYGSFLSSPATKPKFRKFKSQFKIYEIEELNTISEVLEQEERLHMAHLLAKKELP